MKALKKVFMVLVMALTFCVAYAIPTTPTISNETISTQGTLETKNVIVEDLSDEKEDDTCILVVDTGDLLIIAIWEC